MKTKNELISNLRNEIKDLNAKIEKLEYFLTTDDFANKTTELQKKLLVKQHKIMGEYKGVLIQRAHLFNKEGAGKENHPAEESDAPEDVMPIPLRNKKCLSCRYCITVDNEKFLCAKRDAKGDCYEEDK